MTVYVDDANIQWRGKRWCHMLSDESLEELHALAKKCGLKRTWFQKDHYDVTGIMRKRALEKGAVAISYKDEDFHRIVRAARQMREA